MRSQSTNSVKRVLWIAVVNGCYGDLSTPKSPDMACIALCRQYIHVSSRLLPPAALSMQSKANTSQQHPSSGRTFGRNETVGSGTDGGAQNYMIPIGLDRFATSPSMRVRWSACGRAVQTMP